MRWESRFRWRSGSNSTSGEGRSSPTAPGIHHVTSPDMRGFRMTIGGVVIDVNFGRGALQTPLAAVHDWISRSACAVTTYYGRFPVKHLDLLIVPVEGQRGVLNGRTMGYGAASTKVSVGQLATEEDLKRDWVMTHEMVHLAFPSVAEQRHWIEEGLATYVEPIRGSRQEISSFELIKTRLRVRSAPLSVCIRFVLSTLLPHAL
jgi:hypothetical protein